MKTLMILLKSLLILALPTILFGNNVESKLTINNIGIQINLLDYSNPNKGITLLENPYVDGHKTMSIGTSLLVIAQPQVNDFVNKTYRFKPAESLLQKDLYKIKESPKNLISLVPVKNQLEQMNNLIEQIILEQSYPIPFYNF